VTTPLPVLPQIIVEAGLIPDAPAGQAGLALRLSDPVFGILDTDTLGTAIGWTDISAQVISFTITRPSTRLQGPLWNYQAGTVSILLDNSTGQFDPDNLAGPYVTGGATQLVPMVPVRVRAVFATVAYGLYSGFADGWIPAQVTYEGGYAELTVAGTDAFKILAGVTLAAVGITGVGADTGARMRDILGRVGWYTSSERLLIDAGNSLLQGTTLGSDALSLMQVAADSEIGRLYVNGAGAIVFRNRRSLLTDSRSNTVQATFGDLPGAPAGGGNAWSFTASGTPADGTYFIVATSQAALITAGDWLTDALNPDRVFTVTAVGGPFAGFNNISITPAAGVILAAPDVVTQVAPQLACAAIGRASDDTTIANDVQATRVSGGLQEIKDTASIAKYLFPRTYARADLILQGDPDALSWAQWVLYVSKGGEDRFETIQVDPAADPYNLWPQVLGREMGDRIQVHVRPAGVATPIVKDCFIAGITHVWDSPASSWLTTWTLQSADKYGSFFTLDNATLGRLNFNALTF
jgi:hypothetical protein